MKPAMPGLEYFDISDEFFVSLIHKVNPHTLTFASGVEAPWALYQVNRIHRAQPHSGGHRRMRRVVGRLNAAGRACVAAFRRHLAAHLAVRHVRGRAETGAGRCALGRRAGTADVGGITQDWRTVGIRRHPGARSRRWCRSSGYPADQFVFVEGMVEETLPATRPEAISLLRLDTDLYRSTYHELRASVPAAFSGGHSSAG